MTSNENSFNKYPLLLCNELLNKGAFFMHIPGDQKEVVKLISPSIIVKRLNWNAVAKLGHKKYHISRPCISRICRQLLNYELRKRKKTLEQNAYLKSSSDINMKSIKMTNMKQRICKGKRNLDEKFDESPCKKLKTEEEDDFLGFVPASKPIPSQIKLKTVKIKGGKQTEVTKCLITKSEKLSSFLSNARDKISKNDNIPKVNLKTDLEDTVEKSTDKIDEKHESINKIEKQETSIIKREEKQESSNNVRDMTKLTNEIKVYPLKILNNESLLDSDNNKNGGNHSSISKNNVKYVPLSEISSKTFNGSNHFFLSETGSQLIKSNDEIVNKKRKLDNTGFTSDSQNNINNELNKKSILKTILNNSKQSSEPINNDVNKIKNINNMSETNFMENSLINKVHNDIIKYDKSKCSSLTSSLCDSTEEIDLVSNIGDDADSVISDDSTPKISDSLNLMSKNLERDSKSKNSDSDTSSDESDAASDKTLTLSSESDLYSSDSSEEEFVDVGKFLNCNFQLIQEKITLNKSLNYQLRSNVIIELDRLTADTLNFNFCRLHNIGVFSGLEIKKTLNSWKLRREDLDQKPKEEPVLRVIEEIMPETPHFLLVRNPLIHSVFLRIIARDYPRQKIPTFLSEIQRTLFLLTPPEKRSFLNIQPKPFSNFDSGSHVAGQSLVGTVHAPLKFHVQMPLAMQPSPIVQQQLPVPIAPQGQLTQIVPQRMPLYSNIILLPYNSNIRPLMPPNLNMTQVTQPIGVVAARQPPPTPTIVDLTNEKNQSTGVSICPKGHLQKFYPLTAVTEIIDYLRVFVAIGFARDLNLINVAFQMLYANVNICCRVNALIIVRKSNIHTHFMIPRPATDLSTVLYPPGLLNSVNNLAKPKSDLLIVKRFVFAMDKTTRSILFPIPPYCIPKDNSRIDKITVVVLISANVGLGPGLIVFPHSVLNKKLCNSLETETDIGKDWMLGAHQRGGLTQTMLQEFLDETIPWVKETCGEEYIPKLITDWWWCLQTDCLKPFFSRMPYSQLNSIYDSYKDPFELCVGLTIERTWGQLVRNFSKTMGPVTEDMFPKFIIPILKELCSPARILDWCRHSGLYPVNSSVISTFVKAYKNI